jgi:quercetin dioxygenase-like cupin family protein
VIRIGGRSPARGDAHSTPEDTMLTKMLIGAALAGLVMTGFANAQPPNAATSAPPATIKRTPLQKFDVPGTGYETVIGIAEIVPNANIGRHTHPGLESGYMLDGEMVLMIEGQPEKSLKTGDSYQIPSGAIHDGKSGARGAKVIATYVVEKGKPLASPAP